MPYRFWDRTLLIKALFIATLPTGLLAQDRIASFQHAGALSCTEMAHYSGIYRMPVKVGFTVTSRGKAKDIKVISSPGYGLDQNAIKAIKASRFSPALHNGVPVDAHYIQPLVFECAQWDRNAVEAAKAQRRKQMREQLSQALLAFSERIQSQNNGASTFNQNAIGQSGSSLDRGPYFATDLQHSIRSKNSNVIELEDRSLWVVPKNNLDAAGVLLMWMNLDDVIIKEGQFLNSYIMINTSEKSALPVIYLGKEQ